MTYRAGIATRERILDATRALLAEGGIEAATVKAICDQAGILPGSFYNLFPSKNDAVMTVVREAIASLEEDHGERESVSDLVNGFVRFVTSEPLIARVYLIMAVSGGLTDEGIRRRVMSHHKARVERLSAAVRRQESQSSRRAQQRAEAIEAALTGFALHAILDPDFDFAKHATSLLEED